MKYKISNTWRRKIKGALCFHATTIIKELDHTSLMLKIMNLI